MTRSVLIKLLMVPVLAAASLTLPTFVSSSNALGPDLTCGLRCRVNDNCGDICAVCRFDIPSQPSGPRRCNVPLG